MLASPQVREQLATAARLAATENALELAASLIEDCVAHPAAMGTFQRTR
jgi:hypothetical protein